MKIKTTFSKELHQKFTENSDKLLSIQKQLILISRDIVDMTEEGSELSDYDYEASLDFINDAFWKINDALEDLELPDYSALTVPSKPAEVV